MQSTLKQCVYRLYNLQSVGKKPHYNINYQIVILWQFDVKLNQDYVTFEFHWRSLVSKVGRCISLLPLLWILPQILNVWIVFSRDCHSRKSLAKIQLETQLDTSLLKRASLVLYWPGNTKLCVITEHQPCSHPQLPEESWGGSGLSWLLQEEYGCI